MDNKIFNVLGLGETITAEVFRGNKGFYSKEPDQLLECTDLITNQGRIHLAKRIVGLDAASSAMAYMAIGSGTTAPALTDTALVHESVRKVFAVGSAITNNIFTAINTFGGFADSITSASITEAGIFNHATAGECFQRVTFSAVTLANSDLLKLTLQTNVGSNTI